MKLFLTKFALHFRSAISGSVDTEFPEGVSVLSSLPETLASTSSLPSSVVVKLSSGLDEIPST